MLLANNIFCALLEDNCWPSGNNGVSNPKGKALMKLFNCTPSSAHVKVSVGICLFLKVKFSIIVPSKGVSP